MQNYARGIAQPTNLSFDTAGRLWVSSGGYVTKSSDGVWLVRRRGATPRQIVKRLYGALGVLWYRNELYVSHVAPYRTGGSHYGRVVAFSRFDGRRFRRSRIVVRRLPVGRHWVDSLAAGPDGRIYVGVGSKGDTHAGSKLSATVLSFRPSGSGLRVEAKGMRNPYGLSFMPGTDLLFVSDNGRDDLGRRRPPEELNVVDTSAGARHYGFPRCYEQGGAACRGTVRALAKLPPHAASGGVAAVESFGPYGPSAFVALHGSTIASPPTGAVVMRVALTPSGGSFRGKPVGFAKGFKHFDPLGVTIGPGGALYVTLWRSGRVIRFVPRAGGAAARLGVGDAGRAGI